MEAESANRRPCSGFDSSNCTCGEEIELRQARSNEYHQIRGNSAQLSQSIRFQPSADDGIVVAMAGHASALKEIRTRLGLSRAECATRSMRRQRTDGCRVTYDRRWRWQRKDLIVLMCSATCRMIPWHPRVTSEEELDGVNISAPHAARRLPDRANTVAPGLVDRSDCAR
jgi:hypothetical protein